MDEQTDIIFREKQKFAIWVHVLLILTVLFSVSILIVAFRAESAKANSQGITDIFTLFISLGVPIVIEIFFIFLKLETEVGNDGLYVRFFPLNIHFKRYPPAEISECFARKYNPIIEYGGCGIRYSIRSGKAYNVRGNEGVQLVFINGKKLLIGSQKAQELEQAIQSIMR